MTAPNVGNPTRPAVTNQLRLPRTAALGPGRGGQQRLLIDAPAGAAEIYLHGATVTSWVPRGGSEVIFTSRQAVFDGATAIRGGIPLCLPEFGVGINGDAVPKHGWARIAPWRLRTVTTTTDGGHWITRSLALHIHPTLTAATLRQWIHRHVVRTRGPLISLDDLNTRLAGGDR